MILLTMSASELAATDPLRSMQPGGNLQFAAIRAPSPTLETEKATRIASLLEQTDILLMPRSQTSVDQNTTPSGGPVEIRAAPYLITQEDEVQEAEHAATDRIALQRQDANIQTDDHGAADRRERQRQAAEERVRKREELLAAGRRQIDAIFNDVPNLHRYRSAAKIVGYCSGGITFLSPIILIYAKAQLYIGVIVEMGLGATLSSLKLLHLHFCNRIDICGKRLQELMAKYPELEHEILLQEMKAEGRYIDFFAQYLHKHPATGNKPSEPEPGVSIEV